MEITNVFTIACDAEMEHEGFRIQQAGITKRIGAELLAGNVYDVDPGKKLWPYHHHHANEEWLVVLRGRPTLRTRDGERELVEGDVACFVRGSAGAHQIRNATEEPVRILMLSTRLAPDNRVPGQRQGAHQGRKGRRHLHDPVRRARRLLGRRVVTQKAHD
jgi:uncharacterized cupin superfamily protein